MNQTWQEFLASHSAQVPVLSFILNLFLTALLALILGHVYTRYGKALSNRRSFAANFILIATTTTLVISIVKASLALSLGLVGALSIVRFRAAIKEPEELAYVFLCIAIGLGFGADQAVVTVIAFVIILTIIWLRSLPRKAEMNENLHLTISSRSPGKIEIEKVIEVLKKHCSEVSLRRLDETVGEVEASFLVRFDSYQQLKESKSELQGLNESVAVTYLDSKGIV